MSQFGPVAKPQPNGVNKPTAARPAGPAADPPSGLDTWSDDLREEMERLAAENRSLLASVGGRAGREVDDARRLRAENAELRRRVEELERLLREQSAAGGDWAEEQKEYEALLEEKSDVIRDLHHRLAELRQAAGLGGAEPAGTPHGPGGADTQEEILRLRCELEQQRAQLKQDEEALEQQMKQMELTMARERAELARQRIEVQRMHNELRREMEQAARDSGLRERLQGLQRRQQDGTGRRAVPTMTDISLPDDEQPANEPRKQSGVLRKLFGS
jgi:DNA repair exonuclease SbcCD ATPase subunit